MAGRGAAGIPGAAGPPGAVAPESPPAGNAPRVRLLDVPVLKAQPFGLERRVSQGGKDSIDHPARGHDDAVNAAAWAIIAVAAAPRFTIGGRKVTI